MLKQHFSHRHPLCATVLKPGDDGASICSGCDLHLSHGVAYKCTKPNCDFHLHDLCFDLPQEIQHASHPKHPLTLVAGPPYADGEFVCNACGDFGSSFSYHCPRCQFDLHIQCATLPESLISRDHEHPLQLFYSLSITGKENELKRSCDCGICEDGFFNGCWVYCCGFCDYRAHVDCVVVDGDGDGDEDEKDSEMV